MKPTIKIASTKHPQGWVLLDEDAFDPAVHQEYHLPERIILGTLDIPEGFVVPAESPTELGPLFDRSKAPRRGRPRKTTL